jgi:alkylresorcinol/alkylpyrone synthase/polyketide synthase Type III
MPLAASIVTVASAFPPRTYTQTEIRELLGIESPIVKKLLGAPHIRTRRLLLPEPDPSTGRIRDESPLELQRKFREGARDIGGRAVRGALGAASLAASDIDYLMCITTTGFMVPGLSSLISRELRFRTDLQRADLVGMGCNAGLNGLNLVVQWARAHEERIAVLLCLEINSAMYHVDDTARTGIVNSLFGDGAVAVVVSATANRSIGPLAPRPFVRDFESFCVPEQWDAMRFDWQADANKWSFYLSRDIHQIVGQNVDKPVDRLLRRNGLGRRSIRHWVVHTGGGAVVDAIRRNLDLDEHAVRHTRSVLRDYGNISSGSFLVSLERLLAEGSVVAGDTGVMITMGPGAQIETALLEFRRA